MKVLLTLGALLGLLVFAACGDDDGGGDGATTAPTTATEGTEVDVELQEFSVLPGVDSVEAGEVTFNVENTGPDDVHEFVVIKTDLDPDALPTVDDGSVDEEGAGIEVIGEIEDIPVGETQSVTLDLEAGSYALICNIFDETENEAHYAEGMRTAFTVE
ncbi:MAG TPA: hypothetical protein VGR43_04990 [Dehalococcoidia bacterium]|jgi:uncharacterized cupredoxin-like copper-binding protein|nr:hypothetical protein [Dehalococcoidia bacterium]